MKEWMKTLNEEELKTVEKLPNHEEYYTYRDRYETSHLYNDESKLCSGKEIEVFSNGDYAVTTDYDTWTLYRDEDPLCTGVWVTSHTDGSYKYKFFNTTFNKYVIRSVDSDGNHSDEVEGHEEHQAEQFDYNVV